MWKNALGALAVLGLAGAAGVGWVACSTALSEEPEAARVPPSPDLSSPAPAPKPVVWEIEQPIAVVKPSLPAGTPAHGILMATYYMDTWGKLAIDLDAKTMHIESRWMSYEPQDATQKLSDEDIATLEELMAANWNTVAPPDPGAMDVHETLSISEGKHAFLRDTTVIEQDGSPTAALRLEISKLEQRFPLKRKPD